MNPSTTPFLADLAPDEGARRILEARTRALALRGRGEAAASAAQTVLLCEIAGSLYGLAIGEIERVEPFDRHGAAPAGHPAFVALASVAGRVRSVMDLATLLGSPAPEAGGYLIVPRGHDGVALRIAARPVVVEVELLEDDGERACVRAPDEHAGRIVGLLTVQGLMSSSLSAAPTGA